MSILVGVQRLDGTVCPVDIEMLPYEVLPPPWEMYAKDSLQGEAHRTRSEGIEHRKYQFGEMVFVCKVTTTSFKRTEIVGKTPWGLKILQGPTIGLPEIEHLAWEIANPAQSASGNKRKKPGRKKQMLDPSIERAVRQHENQPDIPIRDLAEQHRVDERKLRTAIGTFKKAKSAPFKNAEKQVKPS